MGKFLVKNNGSLKGELDISGSKNAVLPIMASTILTKESCAIQDVPDLRDVSVMCQILESLGVKINADFNNNEIQIEAREITLGGPPYDLSKLMCASILVMGPLLARTGYAKATIWGDGVSCVRTTVLHRIGLHLKGFRALGAEIEVGDNDENSLQSGFFIEDIPETIRRGFSAAVKVVFRTAIGSAYFAIVSLRIYENRIPMFRWRKQERSIQQKYQICETLIRGRSVDSHGLIHMGQMLSRYVIRMAGRTDLIIILNYSFWEGQSPTDRTVVTYSNGLCFHLSGENR